MNYIKIDDQTKIAYELSGQGNSLVFLNGFGGYRQIWQQQVEYFSKSYQVLTFDYCGQGDSTGRVAQSLEELANDLKIILTKLNISNPVLVAHSMGASVVWKFRALYPTFKIQKIAIVDQTPKMINDPDWSSGFIDLNVDNINQHLKLKHKLHESLHGLVRPVMNELISAQIRHPFNEKEGESLIYDHLKADWRPQIEHEKVPVLLVIAIQSPYYNDFYGEYLKKRNTNIQVVKIPDCGHVIMAEVSNAFNQTLRHFLKQKK